MNEDGAMTMNSTYIIEIMKENLKNKIENEFITLQRMGAYLVENDYELKLIAAEVVNPQVGFPGEIAQHIQGSD